MSPRNYITIGIILLMIVFFQQGSTYAGRLSDHDKDLANCIAMKVSRDGLVMLAESVQDGFRATDERVGLPLTPNRVKAEAKVDKALKGFRKRALVQCDKSFPKPPMIQFH